MSKILISCLVPTVIWILHLNKAMVTAEIRFTNFICEPLDQSFARQEYCYIKAVNRSYSYISAKVNLLRGPLTNLTGNIALLKRENGYKPFLYNITFDVCAYARAPNKNPVLKYLVGTAFLRYSNVNHSCPIYDYIIVEKLDTSFLNHQFTKLLPFPKGDYALDGNWRTFNKPFARFRIAIKIS